MTDSEPSPECAATAATNGSRRHAMRHMFAWAAAAAAGAPLAGCGGGSGGSEAPAVSAPPPVSPPVTPPPTRSAALRRLLAALQAAAPTLRPLPPTVTQGAGNDTASTFGAGAQVWPPLLNPAAASLAMVDTVWGFRRDRWSVPRAGQAAIAGQVVYPVTRKHRAATLGSEAVCGLHFMLGGSAFEVLLAGSNPNITLRVDGQCATSALIERSLSNGVAGPPLNQPNAWVRVDFGSEQLRRVSLYARSSQGPCAIAVAAGDRLQPWDRSAEASMSFMSDSYGGASGPLWGVGGVFWEAAALLGIPHIDGDAIGGTGYAPNNIPVSGNAGNAFPARLASSVDTAPDLFITAGGINDNNSLALPPYATAQAARDGFNAAVSGYYTQLRAALPQSVLVALGPWAPRQATPTDAVAQSKADTIRAALVAAGGPWIFLDNLSGGWSCSSGAVSAGSGPWQTGTGNSAAPAGDGNGDLYLAADGVHPNAAGALHLATRMATDLRQALLTL